MPLIFSYLMTQIWKNQSTGVLRELLTPLKIKANVVHVGLSLQPQLLNPTMLLKLELFSHFLNSNLLIVQPHMVIMVATVVLPLKLSNTLKIRVLRQRQTTPTSHKMETALEMNPKSRFMSLNSIPFKLKVQLN